MSRIRKRDVKIKKAPIVTVTFGGAVLCFCLISHTMLVITLGFSLIGLGIWLMKNA